MSKYNKQIKRQIYNLLCADEYTQKEICAKVGIDEDTFIRWKNKYSDFADLIKRAEAKRVDKRLVQCSRSLEKLICGFTTEEERTEYVNDGSGKATIRAQYVVKKEVPPNLGAIIHYQTNKDAKNWVNRQRMEVTGKDGQEFVFPKLSEEQVKKALEYNNKL